jgi:hypothetical protein|tara:strand:- start:2010 stop:2165 length:156 start_codon:yes stop_codon:yes gene_type:complete
MTVEYGLLLFCIGITLSVIGLSIAYYIGSNSKDIKEYPSVLREFYERNKVW